MNSSIKQEDRDQLSTFFQSETGLNMEQDEYTYRASSIPITGWPTQHDSSGCGVYVSWYALKILNICKMYP